MSQHADTERSEPSQFISIELASLTSVYGRDKHRIHETVCIKIMIRISAVRAHTNRAHMTVYTHSICTCRTHIHSDVDGSAQRVLCNEIVEICANMNISIYMWSHTVLCECVLWCFCCCIGVCTESTRIRWQCAMCVLRVFFSDDFFFCFSFRVERFFIFQLILQAAFCKRIILLTAVLTRNGTRPDSVQNDY